MPSVGKIMESMKNKSKQPKDSYYYRALLFRIEFILDKLFDHIYEESKHFNYFFKSEDCIEKK